MKAHRVFLLCIAAAATPQLAMAELPSPQTLGMVNAILTYCAQVDPADAGSFQAQWISLVGGATSGQLGGGAYQKSFDLITDQLKDLSRPVVAKDCAAGARQWIGKPAREQNHGKDEDKDKDRDKNEASRTAGR